MPTTDPYRGSWAKLSRKVRQLDPACNWCGTSDDLCADHLVPGKPEFGVRTLCRGCNTRRRNGATGPASQPPRTRPG